MSRKKEKDPRTGRIDPKKFNLSKLKDSREMFAQFDAMSFVERHLPPGMTKEELHRQIGLERHYLSAHRHQGEIELALIAAIGEVVGENMLDYMTQDLPDRMLENRLTRSLREQQKRDKETIYALNDRLIDSERQKEDYRDLLKGK